MSYPTIEKVLAGVAPPLLNEAKVDAQISAVPYGDDIDFEVMSANLVLPKVTWDEYMKLPSQFKLRVKYPFSNQSGVSSDFYFTFDVNIVGLEKEGPSGDRELVYNARLKKTEHT